MTEFDINALKDELKAGLEANAGEDGLKEMDVDDLMDAMSHPKAADIVKALIELEPDTIQSGEPAPDFTLPWLSGQGPDGSSSLTLSDYFDSRPVALIFGSYTCPPFRAQAGTLNEIYREFSNQVEFFVVYIKEIHPTDGWQVKENEQDAILFRTHESLAERVAVGRSCMIKLALEMPALVDEMDDAVATIYGAMPERLYLISRDGNVAYKSGVGPMFFKPREWQEAIRSYLAEER